MLPASAASKTRDAAVPDQISSLLGMQLINGFLEQQHLEHAASVPLSCLLLQGP